MPTLLVTALILGLLSVQEAGHLPGALPTEERTGSTQAPLSSSETAVDTLRGAASFDTVWVRIRDTHYDPELGGLDWEGLRAELRPRAAQATSQAELRRVIRELLDHLGESHFVLIPSGAEDPASVGGGTASPGMDLRWLDQGAVVTRVEEGGGAHRAGIQPGELLLAMENESVEALLERAHPRADAPNRTHPPYWEDLLLTNWIQGDSGEERRMTLLDRNGQEKELTVELAEPAGELVQFGHLPPFRLAVTERTLRAKDGRPVGLIRFTGWFPQITSQLAEAVHSHRESQGIILDLRGNPGGVGGLVMGVGGHFLDERLPLGEMHTRETSLRFVVNPQRIAPDGSRVEPFQGPLAILVDGLSASTTEIFAGGMQALGRARIFGQTTAGQVLPAVLTTLPNGDRLMHAVADFTAPDGSRLEGTGVDPDIQVILSRDRLLTGDDPVLTQALDWISSASHYNSESHP